MILFVSRIADTGDTVVMSISRTGWNLFALSSDVLGTSYTDTSLQILIISLIVVTVGSEVRLNAISVVVSMVSKVAFAGNSIEGFMFSTFSAGMQNPEIPIFTVALTISQVTIFSTVLIVTASSVYHSEARIANTTLGFFIPGSIWRTNWDRSTFSIVVYRRTIFTPTYSIDVVLVIRTDSFADTSHLSVTRLAKTTITMTVVVVSRVTVGTNSSNFDISRFADAGLCDWRVFFIDSGTRRNTATLSVNIISLSSSTFRAYTMDQVVSWSTVTLARIEVINFFGSAAYSADSLIDIIELTIRTFSTIVVDKMETRFTDTSVSNPVFVH